MTIGGIRTHSRIHTVRNLEGPVRTKTYGVVLNTAGRQSHLDEVCEKVTIISETNSEMHPGGVLGIEVVGIEELG